MERGGKFSDMGSRRKSGRKSLRTLVEFDWFEGLKLVHFDVHNIISRLSALQVAFPSHSAYLSGAHRITLSLQVPSFVAQWSSGTMLALGSCLGTLRAVLGSNPSWAHTFFFRGSFSNIHMTRFHKRADFNLSVGLKIFHGILSSRGPRRWQGGGGAHPSYTL